MGSSLAVFPAIGPVIGGVIAQHFGWPYVFLFILVCAISLSVVLYLRLPETHHADNRQPVSMLAVALQLIKDKRVIGLGLIVAACNGITFSYYGEGAFYLIKLLGLSPSVYGLSFIAIALSTMAGGMLSKKLHNTHMSLNIMHYGLFVIVFGAAVLSSFAMVDFMLYPLPALVMIGVTIFSQMSIMFGVCMATSNALASALVDYKWCIGTASSLFGFAYYCLISLLTFFMGALHNGTLLPMPLYFLSLSLLMLFVQQVIIKSGRESAAGALE